MKNPFVIMAIIAAATAEAFRENKYRDAGIPLPRGRSKSRRDGKRNPAGSKFVMRAYKAKHGMRAADVETAWEWYRGYLKDQDAAVRQREAEKKAKRCGMRLAKGRLT